MEARQIHLKDGKKEYFISLDDVLFVKADGNYCDIYLIQHTIYNTIRIQNGQLWKLIEAVKPTKSHTLEKIGHNYKWWKTPRSLSSGRMVLPLDFVADNLNGYFMVIQNMSAGRRVLLV